LSARYKIGIGTGGSWCLHDYVRYQGRFGTWCASVECSPRSGDRTRTLPVLELPLGRTRRGMTTSIALIPIGASVPRLRRAGPGVFDEPMMAVRAAP
jgi:methyl coenzyme M reductase subunit C